MKNNVHLQWVVFSLLLTGNGHANELVGQDSSERTGPLAHLPSKPGPHIAKIKAMGDNQWLNLGSPKPDPKWGKARGRSWTFKMPFAPALRGAFLYGTGVHDYVKPDGHYQDDLFFYDINAHQWICCYPGLGVNPEHPNLTVDKNGWERDASGQPIPVINGHAWGHVTYDTHRQMFVHARLGGGSYRKLWAKRGNWYSRDMEKKKKPHSPWAWNTASGKWECEPIAMRSPRCANGATFTYVPSIKQYIFMSAFTYGGGKQGFSAGRVYYFDPASNAWSVVDTKLTRPNTIYDGTSCYDIKRDRIYIGGGISRQNPKKTLWIYDVRTKKWSQSNSDASPLSRYPTSSATMRFDASSDMVIVSNFGTKDGPNKRGVYAFNPETKKWLTEKVSDLPNGYPVKGCTASFYDPALNVHFYHIARDSKDNGSMWVYRYKRNNGD